MSAMKSMMVHVVDSSISMTDLLDDKQSVSKFSMAKTISGSFLLQRMLATKTIEYGLIKFGEQDGQPFAEEVIPLRRPCLDTLTDIQQLECGTESSDLYEGLDAAYKIVTETNKGKKFNRVVVLFTDAEKCLSDDSDSNELIMSMKNDGCIVYIILLINPARLESLSSNIEKYNELALTLGGYMLVARDLSGAMKFLAGGPGLSTRPTQSKMTFEISPDFKIPCVYCTKTSKAALPSLKKQSNLSYDPDIPDSGKVSFNTVYRNPTDPDEELEFEDRVKGYKYGPQYIPFGGMDDDILKLKSPPVLRLLGFVPADSIPRHHFLDACHVVGTAHTTTDGAAARKVILSLAHAMKTLNQVALARLVKRENSDPWLVALIPPPAIDSEEGRNNGILYMHRLPCAEDIRNFLFPPLTCEGKPLEATGAVAAAIDSMTVSGLQSDGLLMYNPAHLSVLSALQQKAGASKTALPGVLNFDDTFQSLGDTPECHTAWVKVRKHFDLQFRDPDAEKGRKKKKIYWADVDITGAGAVVDATSSGTGTAEGEVSVKEEVYVKSEETKVEIPAAVNDGSVTPAEDMLHILTVHKSLSTASSSAASASTDSVAGQLREVERIIRESLSALRRIVELLVTTGGTNAHFRKSLACLKAMKEGSIAAGEHVLYNSYMQDTIKSRFRVGRFSRFWEMVVEEKVTLISDEDTFLPGAVTSSEAMAFLSNTSNQSVVAPVVEVAPAAADDDDLFDDMM